MVVSLVNGKLVVGHDYARSPHNVLLKKNNNKIDHHKCTIQCNEETSSKEHELCMQLIGNGYK